MLQLRYFSFVVRADYVSNWHCQRVLTPPFRDEGPVSFQ